MKDPGGPQAARREYDSRTVYGMAGRYTRGYQSHRGRRRRGSLVLKVIIGILAVLLAACLVSMLFLEVEYTDGGVQVRLPWLQEEAAHTPAVSDPVVIITQRPSQPPSQAPAEPELEAIAAVEVTPGQLADGTAAQAVAAAGGDALLVEMKGSSGALAWVSQVGQAASLGANGTDGRVAQAVSALAGQGELYLVARVCCFRDQALASAGVGGPLMTRGGNIWYDAQGLRWVSPVSQQVRDYLTQLCTELSEMGFDEIVLECAGFPEQGETFVLATSENRPADLTAPVAEFFRQLSQALEGSGTALSVQVSEQTVLGTDTLTGLTPALLAQYAHRVWTQLPDQGGQLDLSALEQAGMERAQERIVSLGGRRPAGSWA